MTRGGRQGCASSFLQVQTLQQVAETPWGGKRVLVRLFVLTSVLQLASPQTHAQETAASRANEFAVGPFRERVAPISYLAASLSACAERFGASLSPEQVNGFRMWSDALSLEAASRSLKITASAPEEIRKDVQAWGLGYLAGQAAVRPKNSLDECIKLLSGLNGSEPPQ